MKRTSRLLAPLLLTLLPNFTTAESLTETEGWASSVDLGATVTSGNTDTTLLNLGINSSLKRGKNEYAVKASYTYGEDDGNATADELLASLDWNRLISKRAYLGAILKFRRDELSDIDYRVDLTAKGGYYFIKSDDRLFSLEAGPGLTIEKAGGKTDQYATFYLGQKYEEQLNDSVRLFQSLNLYTSFSNFDDYRIIGELGAESKLSENLNLKVLLQNQFENEPAAGREQNDFKLVTGINYKF